ncbi:MAG: hypothetical protein FIA92_03260 [Chloroflexi bacterium]|nr:hypothetical protein [Chloroflexota bacterium]
MAARRQGLICGLVLVVIGQVAACSTSALDAACAAGTHLPTPVSDSDMSRLERIKEAISNAEMTDRAFEINMVDADETTGTVVVGVSRRTLELCTLIHARYGPIVQIIEHGPGVLF